MNPFPCPFILLVVFGSCSALAQPSQVWIDQEIQCQQIEVGGKKQDFTLRLKPGMTDINYFETEKDQVVRRSERLTHFQVSWKKNEDGELVPEFAVTSRDRDLIDAQVLLFNRSETQETQSTLSFALPKLDRSQSHVVLWQRWTRGDQAVYGAEILDADSRLYCVLKRRGETVNSTDLNPVQGGAHLPQGAVQKREYNELRDAQRPLKEKIQKKFEEVWLGTKRQLGIKAASPSADAAESTQ